MIVPAYTFRPMTRMAMVIERIAAETGHPALAILRHAGSHPRHSMLLRWCRSFMFERGQFYDAVTGTWGKDPAAARSAFRRFRDDLVSDIDGQDA